MREYNGPIPYSALVLLLSGSAYGAMDLQAPLAPHTAREAHPAGMARLRVAAADIVPVIDAGTDLPAADADASPAASAGGTQGNPQPAPTQSPTDDAVPATSGGGVGGRPRIRWQLAPVVWGGDLGYEARMTRNQGQGNTFEQLVIGNVHGRSYVWQPWFVQVRGGLGVVLSRLNTSGNGNGSDQQPVSLTGNVGLTVFPVSRFPFDLSYEITDSRTNGDIASADYTSERFSVRQSYTTPSGGTFMSARYDRSVLESDTFGRDRLDSIEANLSHTLGHHNLQFDLGHSLNERDRTAERTSIERASFRDSYRPNALTSVETQAYVNATDYDPGSTGSASSTGTRTSQLTSFATWRPSEVSKLYFTGSLRALALENDNADERSKATALNGSLGVNYQYNDATRFLGNLSLSESKSGDTRTLSSAESIGVSYTPAFKPLGKYLFSWSASGSVANQTTSDEDSRQAVSSGLGYNLLRNFEPSGSAQTSASFGQTVSTTYDTESGTQLGLTTSAGLSWSRSSDSGMLDYASATASDSRTWGDLKSEFQMLNIQATRQSMINAQSSWSGNLTVQFARQRLSADSDEGALIAAIEDSRSRALTYSVNLNYQHQRAFGIRNLRFLALATANSHQLESRRAGDINAPLERIDNAFELRFDYLIGRLLMRLSARTAEIDGRRQEQIFFRVTRYFGTP